MASKPYVSRRHQSRHRYRNTSNQSHPIATEELKETAVSDIPEALDATDDSETMGEIIKLNVGGVRFETTRRTLVQKSGYFKALLSGKYGDKDRNNGCYFLDRDPEYFKYLLRYLRYGYVQIPRIAAVHLQSEAAYYQIEIDFTGIEERLESGQIVISNRLSDTNGYTQRAIEVDGNMYTCDSPEWKQAGLPDRWASANVRDHAFLYARYLVKHHAYRFVMTVGDNHHTQSTHVLEKHVPEVITVPLDCLHKAIQK